ncbi:MAG: SGNH/GDSL hydrolase family protein [Janthinobacterium svalbardensis]
MTITIPTMSPFPGRGAAPEDYIAQADTTMQQLPGVIAKMNELGAAFNLGAGVLAGGYLPPVPYAAGINMILALQTVQRGTVTYAPLIERLPFVTGIEFDATAWRVVQGVTSAQLAEADGSEQIGHGAGTIKDKFAAYDARSTALGQFDVILDGDSFLAPGGGNNWVDMFGSMSSFAGRGAIHNVAVPGRPMAGTWAAYATKVRPLIRAAVAVGRKIYVIMDVGPNDYGLRPANEIFVPFDLYVSAVKADGGILVPMLPTRRIDWSAHEGTRLSLRQHILNLGLPMTIPTDLVFTDPSFDVEAPQSADGIHMNPATSYLHALLVNSIFAAGASFAHLNHAQIKRQLSSAQIPYTNTLGQLTTDGALKMELATDGQKTLALALLNSFPQAGKTALRLGTVGEFKAWELGVIGDISDYHEQLARSLVMFDLWSNQPLLALSVYKQMSTMYGRWVIRRGGVTSDAEEVMSGCAYPAANNTPGKIGQIARNEAGTKIAMYSGDGVNSHRWAVCVASPNV